MNGDGTGHKGLVKALLKLIGHLENHPFLSLILGITIVLAIAAIAQIDVYVTIVIVVMAVALFGADLFHLERMSSVPTEDLVMRLGNQIIKAIKDEGYIPGNKRMTDFGAVLVEYILKTNIKGIHRKAVKKMAQQFKHDFGVPDSYSQ